MKRALTVAVLGMVVATQPASAFDASCWFTGRWEPQTIEVYVNSALTSNPATSCGGTPIAAFETMGASTWDAARVVQMSIAAWNESGGQVRMVFAGNTNSGCMPGGIVIGVVPGSCDSRLASAYPYDANSDGYTDRGNVYFYQKDDSCSASRTLTSDSVFLMIHELGHVLGRKDAYEGSTCGQAHRSTVMSGFIRQGLTGYDKAQHQDFNRYGGHRHPTALFRRTYTTSWGPATSTGTDVNTNIVAGPGLGASYVDTSLRVPVLDDTDRYSPSGSRERGIAFSHAEAWGSSWVQESLAPAKRHPVALAIGSGGAALQAYAYHPDEDRERWDICYQKSTDGAATFATPTCIWAGLADGTYKVGATYDPLSGRFLITAGTTQSITIISTPRLGIASPDRSSTVIANNIGGASIACAGTQPIDAPLYSNCRVAFISTDSYVYPIRWFTVGADSYSIFVGSTIYQSVLTSEHAPALAWRGNDFHLAHSLSDQNIYHYKMGRTSTTWTQSGTLNTSGWVSPPMLSPTKSGTSTKLHAFWLSYETFP